MAPVEDVPYTIVSPINAICPLSSTGYSLQAFIKLLSSQLVFTSLLLQSNLYLQINNSPKLLNKKYLNSQLVITISWNFISILNYCMSLISWTSSLHFLSLVFATVKSSSNLKMSFYRVPGLVEHTPAKAKNSNSSIIY